MDTPATEGLRNAASRPGDDPADLAALWSPFDLGPLRLKNRLAMAPMTRQASPDGIPGADVAAYYARRAASLGLVITEGAYIDHPSAGTSDRVPRLYGNAPLEGWRGVVDAVHAAGGLIFPQLWHLGAMRRAGSPPVPEAPVVSPSGIGVDGVPVGEPMTLHEIEAVIDAFARAARTAVALGFDGVEVHGAHGYLIDQFLWPHTNRRTDRYGEDRAAFAREVVTAVRDAIGPTMPISFRFSQWKVAEYEARIADSPEALERLLTPLVDAGVDVFHASTRRFWEPEFAGSPLTLAGWTKRITGRPVMAVGSVGLASSYGERPLDQAPTSLAPLARLIEAGEFDLVAVGRALLGDDQWAAKMREGQVAAIRPYTKESAATLW